MILELLFNPFFIGLLIVLASVFIYVIRHEEFIPGFIFLLFASLGAILQISSIGQIGLLRALILISLLGVLVIRSLKNNLSFPVPALSLLIAYLFFIYISGSVNSIPFSDYRSEVGLLIMAAVVSLAPNSRETLRALTISIMLWGMINAMIVVAAKLGVGFGRLELFNEGGRAIGLSRHSTFMGAYFSISLVAVQLLYIESKIKILKAGLFLAALLIMLGLLSTIARGAFIGWLAAFLFVQYRLQGMKIGSIVGIFLAAIIGLVAASALGLDQLLLDRFTDMDKDSSAQARIPLLLSSLATIMENPILGSGIGWIDVRMKLQSHNMFMQVLVESGIIGFVLFISILWKSGWSMLKRGNESHLLNVPQASELEKESDQVESQREMLSSGVILKKTSRPLLTGQNKSSDVKKNLASKLLNQKFSSEGVASYQTGLVAMFGAILLNSLTHSFDFFMPLWMLIGVGFMRERK